MDIPTNNESSELASKALHAEKASSLPFSLKTVLVCTVMSLLCISCLTACVPGFDSSEREYDVYKVSIINSQTDKVIYEAVGACTAKPYNNLFPNEIVIPFIDADGSFYKKNITLADNMTVFSSRVPTDSADAEKYLFGGYEEKGAILGAPGSSDDGASDE